MNLRLTTPTQVLLDLPIDKINVEAVDGFFTLLPRHIDFITALKAGIVTYTNNEQKHYIACNQGVLVKKGDLVSISTPFAVLSDTLDDLKKIITITFKKMEQERKELYVSMARLELGLTKGLMNLGKGDSHAIL